jgi:hypothetical protein
MRNVSLALAVFTAAVLTGSFAGADDAEKHKLQTPPPALDKLKALEGTWAMTPAKPDEKPMTVIFHPTAAGSAVVETMFPGGDHEMINVFTADGDAVVMTHYCAMGSQPRMKAADAKGNVLKFEFVDAGNIKSRDEAHMDAVTLTIDGDKLTEDWSFYQDGKVMEHKVFEFHRQASK